MLPAVLMLSDPPGDDGFSFIPLHNPVGLGAIDFIDLFIAGLLLALALSWRSIVAPRAGRLARHPVWCMTTLAILPVVLRLILLPHHPVPHPDIYDEFGHLLVAGTLRHLRLANPAHPLHQFFETFFVLQQPTYSSIYPIGNGLALAIGWTLFGIPWSGVLICTAAFCALCYWMLRGWTTPGWALFGGLLAVFQFGPLNQWTNTYWGGAFSAAAGCLVFGALARIRNRGQIRDGLLLGLGLALHLLSRPYESVYLLICIPLFLVPRFPRKPLIAAALVCVPAVGITLLQNQRVTGHWLQLPYSLSQYQYGVPAALTFQQSPRPHIPLTPQQELDYRMQRNFHPGADTISSYFARLFYRIRYYRFYFYPPMYLALIAFLFSIRNYRDAFIPIACLLFALGTNFFPAFQFHYLAAVVSLFVLMSVRGLQQLTRLRFGKEAARVLICLCFAWFAFWYAPHLLEGTGFPLDIIRFDVWNSINHRNPERRIEVNRQLADIPGKLLVFVHYWPQHPFQDEWVYNGADIDGQRIVWARDLGAEDEKLRAFYGDRKALLLEPDAQPPRLAPYEPPSVTFEDGADFQGKRR
jgi:hypothetical protein